MSEIRFCLLGSLTVYRDGAAVMVPRGKQRVILAMLLLNSGRVVRVEELAEALWESGPPPSGPVAVQNYVMRLRKTLSDAGRDRIISQPGGYLIRLESDELDVWRFEALLAAACSAALDGGWDQAAAHAREALELWRGEPLTDVDCEMLRTRDAQRLAELHMQALEVRIDADLHLGRHAAVVAELRQLTGMYPLREHLHGLLMTALYRDGRQAEALASYQQARRILIEELGTEPGPALHNLHQQILTGDSALGSPQDPGPAVKVRPASAMAAASAVDVRFSLPPDSAAFTGREAELSRITAAVLDGAYAGGVVAIHAIGGMPGVGKTALALHAAHVLQDQFPGRCLFIDLHAHTPGQDPMSPETALAGLLAAAGVEARDVPGGLENRAALWRDKMAGQRGLLVLDNAASSRQVVPLLAGGDGCLVLVTSRRYLADLPGAAIPLLLDTLPPQEAQDMFIRLAPRADGDPDGAVAELMGLTGYLPLAISLLARVYARHPSWTLADLLNETKASLLNLTAEKDSVAAAFDVSYRHLSPAQQHFFVLLGLHPGTTTDTYAAAALAGISLAEATRMLDQLHGEGLVTETGHRRYGMHDLLRRYARDHTGTGPDAGHALTRLLDYYQHTAALAQDRLARQTRPGPPPLTPALAAGPTLDSAGQAMAWARAERDSLLACLDHVTRAAQHVRVIALTAAIAELFRRDGPWTEAITRHATAVQSARHLGDRLGQAGALSNLAIMRQLRDDYLGAAGDLEQALAIYRDLGDRLGQANALRSLGDVWRLTVEYRRAAGDLEQALAIYRDLGDRLGQADALTCLGIVRRETGDYRGAAEDLEQALAIHGELGSRLGQVNDLTFLGDVRRETGDYRGATGNLEQALAISRDLGSRLGQANALRNLGDVRRLTGDYRGATEDLEQALAIYRDLGTRLSQAGTLTWLGGVRRETGDYRGAAGNLEQALAISRDLGDRLGQAEILNETGMLHRVTGERAEAEACHQQALELARAIGSALHEARSLAGLGRCAAAAGYTPRAETMLRQAHELLQRIGAADAPTVLAELDALTSQEPLGKA